MIYLKHFLLAITLLGFGATGFSQVDFAKAVQEVISKETSPEQPFSGVILVADHGKIKFEQAFGYREFATSTPLLKTDIFELASVSKQFTAMAIMMLQEQGLLQYDDLVEKYVVTPYSGISIRHLLTHTSGLPDYQAVMDQHWDKSNVAGNADILVYLNRYAPPRSFAPGEKYEYSNTGYVLLASIAEKVTGQDFITFCRQNIFQPLQMRNTDIRTLAEKAALSNFALGHVYVEDKKRYVRADSFPSSNYTIWLGNRKGPGRISSTAQDLLKWDRALYSEKLVKKTTLKNAFTSGVLNDGKTPVNYGFGWETGRDAVLGAIVQHNGDNPGYKTKIIRFIDADKTIIILSNNANMQFEKIALGVRKLLGGKE
jgi:CubicO group peptidase (beta-lactamase class C family)